MSDSTIAARPPDDGYSYSVIAWDNGRSYEDWSLNFYELNGCSENDACALLKLRDTDGRIVCVADSVHWKNGSSPGSLHAALTLSDLMWWGETGNDEDWSPSPAKVSIFAALPRTLTNRVIRHWTSDAPSGWSDAITALKHAIERARARGGDRG